MAKQSCQYHPDGHLRHLLSIADLQTADLIALLDHTETCLHSTPSQTTTPKTLANLFFETSTRTRTAFELAAVQLGWHVLNFATDVSAIEKGESLQDTLLTLGQMPLQAIAVRHPENHTAEFVAETLDHTIPVINAGDGSHEHPTQALTDMFTIRAAKKSFEKLSIAIVGDIKHSRVARSNLHALMALGVPDIRIIAPESLLPDDLDSFKVSTFESLEQGLKQVDVIMMLRFQRERMSAGLNSQIASFSHDLCLRTEHCALAKPDAMILHPGPVNQNVEIASDLVLSPSSHILKQVKHGVAVRTAVIDYLTRASWRRVG